MSPAGFQELCLACRRGMEEGDDGVFLPPLGLLEAMVKVFPEQARGQEGNLASVFLVAEVGNTTFVCLFLCVLFFFVYFTVLRRSHVCI